MEIAKLEVKRARFPPLRRKKKLWYRLRTYLHAELVQYAKKQLSGHILFDQMVNSAEAIRRYKLLGVQVTIL